MKTRNEICPGCPKATWVCTGWQCPVYAEPEALMWFRQGTYCPFNPPKVAVKNGRVRVGQQKQRKLR